MASALIQVPSGTTYVATFPTVMGPGGSAVFVGILSPQAISATVVGATSGTTYLSGSINDGQTVVVTDTSDTAVTVTLSGTDVAGQLTLRSSAIASSPPAYEGLTAPLELPATSGKPLTTQGGITLDDGNGNVLGASLVSPRQLQPPAPPTVTPKGTAGSTSYSYQVCATNAYGSTTPSASGSTSTGNATLSATNYNLVSWAAVPLPAGSTGNLAYDSNLTNAIAAVGPTWSFTTGNAAATIGTADGDWNVTGAGSNAAAIEYIGTGSVAPAGTWARGALAAVTAGTTMTLSALLDGTNLLAGSDMSLAVIYNDNLNNIIGAISVTSGAKSVQSLTFTVPTGATTLQLVPFMSLYGGTNGAAAGLPVSWSQIQLTETSTVQPYEPGPLWTYDVYREVSGAYELIGSTTALAFEDTGQAGGAAPPTTNTSGSGDYVAVPDVIADHVNATPTTPTLSANPPVSGTVYQNTTGGPIIIVIPITATAVGGSAQLALGSTSSPADWGGAEQIGVSGELHNVQLLVPNGWYWSVTTTNATIGTASVLGQ